MHLNYRQQILKVQKIKLLLLDGYKINNLETNTLSNIWKYSIIFEHQSYYTYNKTICLQNFLFALVIALISQIQYLIFQIYIKWQQYQLPGSWWWFGWWYRLRHHHERWLSSGWTIWSWWTILSCFGKSRLRTALLYRMVSELSCRSQICK